jgi:hypothetical protein
MFEGLPAGLLQGASVVGALVTVFFGLIFALQRGVLYTGKQVDQLLDAYKRQAEVAETRETAWREAAEKWQTVSQTALDNNEANIEQGRLIVQLINAIPRNPQRR